MPVLSRLFPSASGPAAPASYSGPFLCGTAVKCLAPRVQWLQGYWWWVCNTGQAVAAGQKFALWANTTAAGGTLVPNSVTSNTVPFTAGQWNYVPLPFPIALSGGTPYVAATGWSTVGTTGFPVTNNQYGTGGPYISGLTSGNLYAYSDGTGGGTAGTANPTTMAQGVFSATLGTDPSVNMPNQGSNSGNFWMDLQVSDTAPPGYSGTYSLYPPGTNIIGNNSVVLDLNVAYNVGTVFQVAGGICPVYAIRYLSPSGAASLATEASIWSAAGLSRVKIASNPAPAWSGVTGSGWVQANFAAPVLLGPGTYVAAVYNANGATGAGWNAKDSVTNAFGPGGDFAAGISNGPLSAPNVAGSVLCYDYSASATGATPPFNAGTTETGQCVFGQLPSGLEGAPYLYAGPPSGSNPQNYFVDVVMGGPLALTAGGPPDGGTSRYRRRLIW